MHGQRSKTTFWPLTYLELNSTLCLKNAIGTATSASRMCKSTHIKTPNSRHNMVVHQIIYTFQSNKHTSLLHNNAWH